MCGVAGRFHPVALGGAPGWASRASALLAHRGPDGEGHYIDDRCELVHRRLALIDLSPTGHQPMANEDGTVYVVFNGEIYNHRDLRSELERRGHRFRGTSDTEVLVHLYEEYGEHMAGRLRGIFAFAIYDTRRRALYLARDRFGVKPLFYALHNGEWVFASEIKAILALPGFRPAIDRQACYDFLGLGYVPEPATWKTPCSRPSDGRPSPMCRWPPCSAAASTAPSWSRRTAGLPVGRPRRSTCGSPPRATTRPRSRSRSPGTAAPPTARSTSGTGI